MRKELVCETAIAGIRLRYRFRYARTLDLFRPYLETSPYTDWQGMAADTLYVSDDMWERTLRHIDPEVTEEWVEFYALIGLTSRVLLKYDRCLFHGVAFLWREKAWIITAPSGTGKTTQYKLWEQMYGDEIELINGDKPAIEARQNGEIWIHPSPWNGKENYAGKVSGPLAGIICLKQNDHNHIERMDIRASMIPVYRQFLYYADHMEEIEQVGRLQSAILGSVPVWKLENTGDEESVRMTYQTLLSGGGTE